MMKPLAVAMILAASAVAACGTGPRVSSIQAPPAGPQNAQDMINNWDAAKKAEARCTYEQAGRQIGVDGKKNDKTVTPACGDYKP